MRGLHIHASQTRAAAMRRAYIYIYISTHARTYVNTFMETHAFRIHMERVMPDSVCMIRHLDVHIFRTVIFGHAQSSRKQSTRNASSLVSRFFCGMCGTHTHTQSEQADANPHRYAAGRTQSSALYIHTRMNMRVVYARVQVEVAPGAKIDAVSR